ncbi:hypothetical protein Tsubulata_038985 [Turnera subulata]|uniref:GRF-type domain-containing protein n=1 Tax=Turnera subulata TaxID=218843 RepID=A0A9Q0JGM6_9ROSI|nr:hypothetical protein Tsubulata_038985 [Turnera subulata]
MSNSSSSASSSSFALRRELELWDDVVCYCGELAPILPHWSGVHPGWQYYGCGTYKYRTGGKNCGFFEWANEEMPLRSKIVINRLREQNGDMLREIEALMIVEEKLMEENNLLKEEVQVLQGCKRDLKHAVRLLLCCVIFLFLL